MKRIKRKNSIAIVFLKNYMRNYEIQKERKKNEEQFEIKEEKLNTKET